MPLVAALGIDVVVGNHDAFDPADGAFGILLQYPTTDGSILDYGPPAERAHAAGIAREQLIFDPGIGEGMTGL